MGAATGTAIAVGAATGTAIAVGNGRAALVAHAAARVAAAVCGETASDVARSLGQVTN